MTQPTHGPALFVALAFCLGAAIALMMWWNKPVASPSDSAANIVIDSIQQQLSQMTLRQKLASLLILHTPGTDAKVLVDYANAYQPGGLILMGDNIPATEAELKLLTSSVQQQAHPFPLLIATDEEGCTVKRLPWDNFACASSLGLLPTNQTKQAFQDRSRMLKDDGVNLNFGIVADITANPRSFIFPRVFGGDAQTVSDRVAAAVQGTDGLTLSTLKHFPGHGETPADSHAMIPTIDVAKVDWLKTDAVPFKTGVKAGADVVMFGHLVYTSVDSQPASLSKKWHEVLNTELGFKGLSITDDMIMLQQSKDPQFQDVAANVVSAINAGNQLVLLVTDHDAKNQPETVIDINALIDRLEQAVKNGQLSEKLVNQAAYQDLKIRSTLTTKK